MGVITYLGRQTLYIVRRQRGSRLGAFRAYGQSVVQVRRVWAVHHRRVIPGASNHTYKRRDLILPAKTIYI